MLLFDKRFLLKIGQKHADFLPKSWKNRSFEKLLFEQDFFLFVASESQQQ
jgi:hypothetical protein